MSKGTEDGNVKKWLTHEDPRMTRRLSEVGGSASQVEKKA